MWFTVFFFSSRRRHTRFDCDWSSDVCSSDLRAALDPSTDMIALWPAELHEDDEVDEINAWIYKVNRDRPLADILNDSHEVFQQLVAEVSALSDEQLNDPQRLPWFEGERLTGTFLFGHFHEEHEPDMRAWLARVKQAG